MAGRIPQHFIDDLIARADIVEVIGTRVALQKHGKEYRACCPFHAEKTPSFYVSPQKQFYHCFGCGAHGTAIGFLMEFEQLDFVESIETLAQDLGLQVPREGANEAAARSAQATTAPLYAALTAAAKFFAQQLRNSDKAKDYLRGRGLTGQTAKRFGLGYAPPNWDSLLRHLQPHFAEANLVSAGLVIRKDNGGLYDRFRDRVIFPIRDRRGRVLGFGGRILDTGEPKYLNSPETPVFHKGRELYGLYEARQQQRNLQQLFVVEGYMDVISLAEAGIENAVATLGTATTAEHVEHLLRVVTRITFCFDGDNAGRQAAWRALTTSLPAVRDDRQIEFLLLPQGADPDSVVRERGAEGFRLLAREAISLSHFLLETLQRQYPPTQAEGRAQLANAAKPLLQSIPEGLLRDQLISTVARLIDSNDAAFKAALRPGKTTSADAPARPVDSHQVRLTPVRQAIAVLLARPDVGLTVTDLARLRGLDAPGMGLLCNLLEIVHAHPNLNTASLWERIRDTEYAPHLHKLMQWLPTPEESAIMERLFQDAVNRLLRRADEQRIDELLQLNLQRTLTEQEKHELRELFKRSPSASSSTGSATP